MRQLLLLLLLLSETLSGFAQYRTKLRPEGNNYSFAPQAAKAYVGWIRFPRFNLTNDWIYWGPRFRKRTGVMAGWDDDFMRHGFNVAFPVRRATGIDENTRQPHLAEDGEDLQLPGSRMIAEILMPATPGQMPSYLSVPFNNLPDSDPRKAEIRKYIEQLIPVTDAASAKLMGNWMGQTILGAITGGKNPKYVTIDEESAYYWLHPEGEGSLRKFVGYMYQGIQEVVPGAKAYTYGPKITQPQYKGFADQGRFINGKNFTENGPTAINFWWSTNGTIDTNSPLAVALRANGGGVLAGDHYWRTSIGMGTIYKKDAGGNYVFVNGRRVLRDDNSPVTLFGKTFTVWGNDDQFFNQNEYDYWTNWLYEELSGEEANRYWMNGGQYALRKNDRGAGFEGTQLGDWYRTGAEDAYAPGLREGQRPLNPQGLEAGAIFRCLLHDADLLWHGEYLQRGPVTYGTGIDYPGKQGRAFGYKTSLGQYEYIVKGLHRFSQFENRPWGNWYVIRPHRGIDANPDKWKEPCIRGRLSETGNHVQIAAMWPMLDPQDRVRVDVWVDTGSWKSGSTFFNLNGRDTYLDAWQIPGVPAGTVIEPKHLRFRFTTPLLQSPEVITWTGDYRFTASNSETIPTAIP